MIKKKCSKCQKIKSINDFYIDKRGRYDRYAQCKKCHIKTTDKWKKDNPDKYYKLKRNWIQVNPEKNKLSHQMSDRKRRNTLRGKLIRNISRSIWETLHNKKNRYHWEDLVGYTFDQFKKHLEKQFTEDMTWDNYGKWHIDHIVPISAFNFKKPEDIDFKKCWSLSNLRPLWGKDNLKKRNKLLKPFQPSFIF